MVQIVTLILVGYGGWHLRRELRTLKEAVATQKATIEAQAEHMKAQSTVLQDFERLNKMMKEFIDTVDAPAMLQRWQQYKALGEYCLCNHLKGEDLSDVAVDPEPGKQRHGKVHHGLGLGDDNGLPV
jgi:hypothetical protein